MAETRLDVEDGKYIYIIDDDGVISVLRDGEPWIPPGDYPAKGSKALIALVHEHIELRAELAKVEEALFEANCALGDLKFGLGI